MQNRNRMCSRGGRVLVPYVGTVGPQEVPGRGGGVDEGPKGAV